MQLLGIDGLPDAPLAAAAAFHARWLPRVEGVLAGEDITLVFGPADHAHRGWRLAAVQNLARAHAPRRINAVVSASPAAIAAAAAYLQAAPGVTGQLLVLDDGDPRAVLSLPR